MTQPSRALRQAQGTSAGAAGPVRLLHPGHAALRPAVGAAITGGFWSERRRVNREVSIPGAWDRLHEAQNFRHLELAAGRGPDGDVNDIPFMDSDVYKWLEAIGWTLADRDLHGAQADTSRHQLAETEDLLRAAQQADGYLDSHFQVRTPGTRWADLAWGHELYCAGHLIQEAVAVQRGSGHPELLAIARRVADLVTETFGPGARQIDGVCGHPEIETALVELYRETADERYLRTAQFFVDRRGHGVLGDGRFGRRYWQDQQPVRETTAVEGHAVRQLYLLAGVADLHLETGDPVLRAAAERLWADMVATQTYLTGGIGAHHKDEAFGDAYELPNERSYCETCAAIASVMFGWRMLMITGEAKYADLMERTLYNGFLAGISLDGQRYIYANPLQVRDDHVNRGDDGDYVRRTWFDCACCPPNVMRLLASLEHYVLLGADRRVVLHQYLTGSYASETAAGQVVLDITTDYPWDGQVRVVVAEAPGTAWELSLRIPEWAGTADLRVNDQPADGTAYAGWWSTTRTWTAGDEVVLDLPLLPRLTAADPRVDAARGCVALEFGPLVYGIEAADNPASRLDDLSIDPAGPLEVGRTHPELGGIPEIRLSGRVRERSPASWWPYRPVTTTPSGPGTPTTVTAIPYYAWGNREPGPMRIWLPTR